MLYIITINIVTFVVINLKNLIPFKYWKNIPMDIPSLISWWDMLLCLIGSMPLVVYKLKQHIKSFWMETVSVYLTPDLSVLL